MGVYLSIMILVLQHSHLEMTPTMTTTTTTTTGMDAFRNVHRITTRRRNRNPKKIHDQQQEMAQQNQGWMLRRLNTSDPTFQRQQQQVDSETEDAHRKEQQQQKKKKKKKMMKEKRDSNETSGDILQQPTRVVQAVTHSKKAENRRQVQLQTRKRVANETSGNIFQQREGVVQADGNRKKTDTHEKEQKATKEKASNETSGDLVQRPDKTHLDEHSKTTQSHRKEQEEKKKTLSKKTSGNLFQQPEEVQTEEHSKKRDTDEQKQQNMQERVSNRTSGDTFLRPIVGQAEKEAFEEILQTTNDIVHDDPKFDAVDVQDQQNPPICDSFNLLAMYPTHGCQFNSDTHQMYCNFINLRVDSSLIYMAQGGEKLETVMGRNETDELPVYSKGAFSVRSKPSLDVPVKQRIGMHYLEDVLNNLVYPTEHNQGNFSSSCVETRNGTTLMITRYEYVNLYHTLTDWWNAFSVLLPDQVERREKVNILFLDGHAHGNLDPVWEEVFGAVEYVKHLPGLGVCFERAVFIPPGYTSSLFPDAGEDFTPARVRCPTPSIAEAFSGFFLKKYGLESVKPIPGRIVIIDRQPYISHPRSNPDGFQRKMNLENLENSLRTYSNATSVEIVRFETMTHAEQVRTVREAEILIGNHGAGLSNLMFMDRSSHVLEFTVDSLIYFRYLAEWKGVHHELLGILQADELSTTELWTIVSKVNKAIMEYPSSYGVTVENK